MSKKKVFYVLSGAILGIGVILAIFILTFGINLSSRAYLDNENVTEHKDSKELKPIATAIGLNSDTYLDVGDDPEKIDVVEVKQITTDGGYYPKSWSPNGAYMAVVKSGHTLLFDADGKMVKKFDRTFRNWSLDSKKIICAGMWLVDVESGEKKKVTEEKGYNPAFLPSGDRVIYHSKDGLSIVDINTGKTETLINGPDDNFSDIWYVSDDKIFFVRGKRKEINEYLFRYNSITEEERKIYSYRVIAPVYLLTPKGEIVIRNGPDPKSGYSIITDENGEIISDAANFARGDWNMALIDFSPNGKLLLFIEYDQDEHIVTRHDLYIYSLDGMKKKGITNTKTVIEWEPKWSPNGDKIFYQDQNENIFIMTISKK
jgi:Tol biopolymer transport system component